MLCFVKSANSHCSYDLYTKRLNQDCLENLFCTFQELYGNNFNPIPVRFYYSFKKIFYFLKLFSTF